ncbi:MAG: GTPase ObgE, partial [Deltaproteobacteria bacterium]|nr:GTPase ObgE [Deltaproteobacteria bacterium]
YDRILDDFNTIISEMSAYNPDLLKKPQLVLINKIDLAEKAHRSVKELQDALAKKGLDSLPISSKTGEGIDALRRFIIDNWLPFNS